VSTPPVMVLGAGGHAKVLIEALLANSVEIAGIFDADPKMVGVTLLGVPVLGGDELIKKFPLTEIRLVNGLGSVGLPVKRRELFEQFKGMGYSFATVVHPSAVVASDAELGEGAQIMAGVVIQPGSRIGSNVIVNTRASVDHDCIIGDHVHIAPGVTLSGGVVVGDSCHIGTAATVIQGICIESGSVIGAGALVVKDVPPSVTVVGVPAKVVKK
jgi:sugar O-acyltransferase (sialic acid O-acetyltransferase NeuD family)